MLSTPTSLSSPTTQWSHLLNSQRLGTTKKFNANKSTRSQFHKDYDRLVFSHSFRQLNQKTQVHPLTNQLGIHTRLTHSLEVSCIGRSLAMMAAEKLHDKLASGLPTGISPADVGVIVQAACLAHDIGNPPFGHAGEYAIRDWFVKPEHQTMLQDFNTNEKLDLLAYEGNAQGFRLLARNEHHPDKGGMRLTCATLGAFMKYPWLATHSNPDVQKLSQSALATKVQKF
ncbi:MULTISPECIES: dGTP triphosphohydrolase, partial [unclassified Psychrobacter]